MQDEFSLFLMLLSGTCQGLDRDPDCGVDGKHKICMS